MSQFNVGDRVRVSGSVLASLGGHVQLVGGEEGIVTKVLDGPMVAMANASRGLPGEQGLWVNIDGLEPETPQSNLEDDERGSFALPSGVVEAVEVAQAA